MKNKHRIFIAINLPDDIKNNLAKHYEKWPELAGSVKWTKKDNLHITLVFLGNVSSDELVEVCKLTKEAVEKHSSFLINLNKICYGPAGKFPPRMIWTVGQCPDLLNNLKNNLSKVLGDPVSPQFSLHITLGRIKQFQWRRIEPEQRPEIDEVLDLNFEANSVEIMESQLKRGGPEYTILESYQLNL